YREHQKASEEIVARCAIVTLSDTRTPDTDTSGRQIRELLESSGHAVADYAVLPDEPARLSEHFEKLLRKADVDVILTTGGTGISRRDQTIDAIEAKIDRPLPGFGELFRMLSWEQIGSGAMLSRAFGGIAGGKVVFAMPGSSKAVE